MELCLLSTHEDFIAIKKPFCKQCAQDKLKAEIINSWPLDPSEFQSINRQIVQQFQTETSK